MQSFEECSTPQALADVLVASRIVAALTSVAALIVDGQVAAAEQACLFAAEQLPLIRDEGVAVALCKLVELVSAGALVVTGQRVAA